MLFALDNEGNKIYIDSTKMSEEYFCPCCGSKMIIKMGDIRVHHFAHPIDQICKDTWHYDMTEWHYDWQNKFPKNNQEVVKEFNGEKHRADVLIEEAKVVFEFQHSPLSPKEFEERNNFYTRLGYKVIWVFDVEKQYENECIDNYRSDLWSWKRPKKTFDYFDCKNKNIQVYLQLNNYEYLVKVTWCTVDNGMSRFVTDGYSYKVDDIVHMFDKKQATDYSQEVKLFTLFDKMIQLNSKDHTTYYFGCPISSTHKCANCNIDIPTSMYSVVMPCMECEYYCNSENYGEIICKKRFLDLNLTDNLMVRVEGRDKNGFINKISYLNGNERVFVNMPTFEQNISKDVFILWEETECYIATFRNVRTGKYIRITKNPSEQMYKYGKVYGYISSDKYNFSKTSCELYGVAKPEWVLDWFKK